MDFNSIKLENKGSIAKVLQPKFNSSPESKHSPYARTIWVWPRHLQVRAILTEEFVRPF